MGLLEKRLQARLNLAKFTAPRKAQTHCGRGHKFTTENTRVRTRRGVVFRECRACERDRQALRGPLLAPEKLAFAREAFRRRLPCEQIKKEIGDWAALIRQRRRDPEFAELYAEWVVGSRGRSERHRKSRGSRKKYSYIRSLLPERLPDGVKDEIVSMIFEALGHRYYKRMKKKKGDRGAFSAKDVPACVKHFVSDYYKLHPAVAYGKVDTPWSLDAPVRYDNDTRVIDTVSRGLWD